MSKAFIFSRSSCPLTVAEGCRPASQHPRNGGFLFFVSSYLRVSRRLVQLDSEHRRELEVLPQKIQKGFPIGLGRGVATRVIVPTEITLGQRSIERREFGRAEIVFSE